MGRKLRDVIYGHPLSLDVANEIQVTSPEILFVEGDIDKPREQSWDWLELLWIENRRFVGHLMSKNNNDAS